MSANMNELMNLYTGEGIAHAELLLVTCLKRKTLRGIKTPRCRCIFCRVPCSLQYPKTKPKSVLYRGNWGWGAIERVPSPPELSQHPSLHHPLGGFLRSICSPK